MVIWGEGLKHPFRSPGWEGGKTPALCISFPVERPGGLGRGPCNSLQAALLGSRALRRGSCAGRGPPPPGAPGYLSSRGHRRGTSPLPSSGRPGTCPTCLLPFSNTTPSGLWSPRERDRAGTKGSLFSGSRGVGVVLARVSRRPWETGRLRDSEPRPASSAALRDPRA